MRGPENVEEEVSERRIPDFEREILSRFEKDYSHVFSLDGERMREALEEAYRVAADYGRSNLSEEQFDARLEELVGKYPELGEASRQTKGTSYLGVMVNLVLKKA